MLDRRRILLGVSGGVAAYKCAYLARLLVEAGAEVRSVMTDAALEFLGPQTLAAITGRQPVSKLFGLESVSPHTELARWGDAAVVAPATAGVLARLANGISSDTLTATLLAMTGPVLLAPAMHTEMWEHPATRRNVELLHRDGHRIVGPATGALAGGDVGMGRMSEPEEIVDSLVDMLGGGDLAGWRVLITAGGTREPIDPVRFVGNRSSGKMGHALADEAARRGAVVTLITSADTSAVVVTPAVEVVEVETAEEMAGAVWDRAPGCNVAIFAAAVADFRPKAPAELKIRRAEGLPEVLFEPTPDILEGVVALEDRPFVVGFAAETGPVEQAVVKATSKGTDLLVANDVTAAGSGFNADENQVTIILPDGTMEPWELLPKREVARRLWDRIGTMMGRASPDSER